MITGFKNVRVLVTGATGFIGSHLTRHLTRLGANVHILIRKRSSTWRIDDLLKELTVWYVDITDYDAVKETIKAIIPQKIFHLAACVNADRSLSLLDEMVKVNVIGTLNLLKSLSSIDFDVLIATGTSEEYGINETPFLECQRESPVSPYSASKVAVTHFCQMLHRVQGLPIIILRPFLTYGPYQDSDMLIPSLIRKALLREEFRMTKGEQTRDFNYVEDIIEGFVKASITEKALGEVINLGCGNEYRIIDVVKIILELMGNPIKPQIGALSYRAGEAMRFFGSDKKAKDILDWEPKVSLQEGLTRTIEWYKRWYHL